MFSPLMDTDVFSTGELDQMPELAFYMVGDITEVAAKADRLAEQRE